MTKIGFVEQKDIDRFRSKYKKGDFRMCWEWEGGTFAGTGYGRFCCKGKQYRAHRVAHKIAHPDVALEGVLVQHVCSNPLCVNPHHMETGANDDRFHALRVGGRMDSKLSPEDVSAIRAAILDGEIYRKIARRFAVSYDTVRFIRSGRRWGWYQDYYSLALQALPRG